MPYNVWFILCVCLCVHTHVPCLGVIVENSHLTQPAREDSPQESVLSHNLWELRIELQAIGLCAGVYPQNHPISPQCVIVKLVTNCLHIHPKRKSHLSYPQGLVPEYSMYR